MEWIVWALIFYMSVVFHEVAHGLTALALGDPTAKHAGRLSLNPLRHIDLFWTILLPAALLLASGGRWMVGMAKPVPVNFQRLRNPKRDMIWVALAGPFANIATAYFFSWLWILKPKEIFLLVTYLNVGLAFFNLVPVPPLDGSKIMAGLLPRRALYHYSKLEPYGFFIIMLLYVTGVLTFLILPGFNFLCRVLKVPLMGF